MAAHPELTTDLESSDTARNDAFWRSDPAGAPAQDWLGYLGLDDAEPLSTEFTAAPTDTPFPAEPPADAPTAGDARFRTQAPVAPDPYASLAAPSDDLLPHR